MSHLKDKSIRVDRVLSMFSKSGGNGDYTKPFSELAESTQAQLMTMLESDEGETAILASYRNSDSWVVLTSERLVWRDGETQMSLGWERIKNATIPMSALAGLKSKAKTENAILEVATDSGKVEVLVEAGKPFSGFWNVLKMVAQLA
jgi:hypothetical protein